MKQICLTFQGQYRLLGSISLFNFECSTLKEIWGCSSAGRAPALQAGGHRFDPVHLHQRLKIDAAEKLNGLIAQVVRAHA